MFYDEASAAEKKVALMWHGKSVMQNRVALGFLARAKEIEPNLAVSVRMEIPTPEAAADIFWEFEKNVDGIIYLRSFGAEFLARAKTRLPLFIGGCNDPRALGVVKNLEAPEGNITGVTYHIPFEKRFEVIQALFPQAKSVGIVLQKNHPVTAIEGPATREQCQKLGLRYHEIVPKDRGELTEAVALLAQNVDLIIISNCVVAFDNVTAILPAANKRGIPIFSYEEKAVKRGAVAGIAASDEKLGRLLADSVVDVVVKGKPIAQVPIKMDPDPKILVNVEMMRYLGLTFPKRVMEKAQLIE
jgi:putative ABC transport system substrate-binding protein